MANRKPKNLPAQKIPANPTLHPLSEHLEMRIPARAEWVRVVRLATAGVASRAGFAYDDIEDIKLAVTEACNNAILHSVAGQSAASQNDGAAPASTPLVTVRWQLVENGVRISVADEGRLESYAPAARAASTPDAPLDELPESGMGLLLIESLMDEVEHEFGPQTNTTIHMSKKVPLPAGAQNEVAATTSRSRPDPDAPVKLPASSRTSTAPSSR